MAHAGRFSICFSIVRQLRLTSFSWIAVRVSSWPLRIQCQVRLRPAHRDRQRATYSSARGRRKQCHRPRGFLELLDALGHREDRRPGSQQALRSCNAAVADPGEMAEDLHGFSLSGQLPFDK